jgi:hypothetical protein
MEPVAAPFVGAGRCPGAAVTALLDVALAGRIRKASFETGLFHLIYYRLWV